ncbi:MAG: HEAT repeat domain-containing protein, partial [Planctomycetaceae bacterium]
DVDRERINETDTTSPAKAWPESIWDCQWEDDAEIKNLFGLWIALVGMPGALETLEDHLLDLRPDVRHAAIVSLGFLGTAEAQHVLLRQAESSSVRMRAEAVRSLSRWGSESLFAFLDDDDAEVRSAAVSGLRSDVGPRALLQIRRAMTDKHAVVQKAAVDALSGVSDRLALSLLFYGLQESQFRARKACWHAITDRLGRPFPFPINKPLEQRRQAARMAAQSLQLESAVLQLVLEEGLAKSSEGEAQHKDDVRRRVAAVLSATQGNSDQQHVALQRVRQLTVNDVPAIEDAVPWPDPRSEILFEHVLPHLHPVYATLENWHTAEHLGERQRAAAEFLLQSRRMTISPLMLERLLRLMRREQDRQIWKHVYDVVANQPDLEVSQRIVHMMLNQPSATVRRMGCEWVS